MSRRLCCLAAGFAGVLLAAVPVCGQAAKASPAKASQASQYVAPRTPWGDPDLQGWFSNRSENGTPLERPAQFAGRKLEDISGAELAAIKQKQQDQTVDRFKGPLSAPEHWWQDDLNMVKGAQAWLITDPPDGKVPSLTQQGKDREAARAAARREHGPADSWLDRSLYDRCITRGMPGSMMPVIYGNSYQILQSPGFVTIRIEMIHESRVIPLDGSPHVSPAIRSYMGDSRGHWEGDTLVVETTNFRDDSTYRGANGATLKVTERFRRTAPDKVRWAVTLDDPETWTQPWTFAMPLTVDDTQPVLEYSCHEGNYGLRNILSAARAEEKQAAEEAAKKKQQ